MGIYDFTFYDLINRNAHSFHDRTAWFEVDDQRTLTYLQYKTAVDRLAAGLLEAGVRKGDRVGVLGKNSLEYFLLYGAVAAVGAVMLPVNWRLSPEEVYFNLNDCEPVLVFADSEYQELVSAGKAKLTSVRAFYNLKADDGRFLPLAALRDHHQPFYSSAVSVATDDGFVIIHTAAVAGRPRGALLSHGNIISSNVHLMLLFNTSPADVHLNLLPLFHVAGLVMAAATFHAGGLNVNMSKFDAQAAVALIEEKKVSLMFDFSPILASILEAHEKSGRSIASLRGVLGLDTAETIEKYQQITGGTFCSMYGQTETSCLATLAPYDDCPGAAGRVIELAEVRLVDDYERPVPAGRTGEIVVRGPMVFKGYWNLPEDNGRTFRDGWHHTGDRGRFDPNGFLWYEGRMAEKELIKPGGENVYPAEVEKVILQHPAVDRTVVFGVPDPKWKEGIKAVCQLKNGKQMTAAELVDFVGARIARYKKPQYVEIVDALPLLADGNPDRDKVKEMYGGEQKK
jgi:acyl-CoA synthetase (AMP-forming)/AMP-acid ligase II